MTPVSPHPDYVKRYNLTSMDRKIIIAYVELTFAVLVWGASFIATKLALRDLAPITVVWLRFGMGVIILGIATSVRHQFSVPKKWDFVNFALLGFLGITFHQWLQSTGLVTAKASTTAWIVSTTPIFIALLSWIFLHERISWLQSAGIILALLGVLLVVGKGDFKSLFNHHFGEPGDILIMVSAVNWAVFSILSRYSLQKHQATKMMFFVMALGWLFTSIQFLLSGNIQDLRNLTTTSIVGISFLGIFCSGMAYIAWYDGLQVIPASQVGAFLFIEPLVAVFFAWLLLGEAFLLATLIGGIIILLGVKLAQRT